MPSIPVDVLYHILRHVDKESLLQICLLNKVCCSCSQDILYRDMRIDGKHFKSTKAFQTLSESTHLAKRVRSFEITNYDIVWSVGKHFKSTKAFQTLSESTHLAKRVRSFENMTCLR